jgi:hypothetical protein
VSVRQITGDLVPVIAAPIGDLFVQSRNLPDSLVSIFRRGTMSFSCSLPQTLI